MKNILNDWEKNINQEDKIIYDKMIEIISDNNISSSSKSFNAIKEWIKISFFFSEKRRGFYISSPNIMFYEIIIKKKR